MAIDLENERKYLQGLMSQNNPGLADWAQNRSRELGISLQAPSAGAQPGTASGGAPSTYMADINQALEAYRASGLLGNRGNVSVQQYTPRPTNVPSRQQLMGQAQSEVNPWMQRQTESTNRLYEDLRKRLPALLNARGQATGGLRNAKEAQLTKEQGIALGDVNLQAQERVAQLVNALQQRAEEQAYRQQQMDYQQYLGGQQLGLQAEGMNQQGDQNTFGNLMSIANYGRGAAESDRSYGLQEQGQAFNQNYMLRNAFLELARESSNQAGVITPQYAQMLGRPDLEGQPTAAAREADNAAQQEIDQLMLKHQNAIEIENLGAANSQKLASINASKLSPLDTLRQKLVTGESLNPQQLAAINAEPRSGGLTEGDVRQKALGLAQKDPFWTYQDPGTDLIPSTPQQRQELINQYTDILNGNPLALPQPAETAAADVDKPSWYSNIDQSLGGWLPFGAPRNAATPASSSAQSDPVSNMIEQALQNGYSDKEIAEALRAEGFNPASYGF